MSFENFSMNETVFLLLGLLAFISIYVSIGLFSYLNSKWLRQVEYVLEYDVKIENIPAERLTYAAHGLKIAAPQILHYATVFLWSFHARRYGMLEQRKNVPKHIKWWFVFAFCWFMTSCILFAGTVIIGEVYFY